MAPLSLYDIFLFLPLISDPTWPNFYLSQNIGSKAFFSEREREKIYITQKFEIYKVKNVKLAYREENIFIHKPENFFFKESIHKHYYPKKQIKDKR